MQSYLNKIAEIPILFKHKIPAILLGFPLSCSNRIAKLIFEKKSEWLFRATVHSSLAYTLRKN